MSDFVLLEFCIVCPDEDYTMVVKYWQLKISD